MTRQVPRRLFKNAQAKEDLVGIYAFLFDRSEKAARQFLKETRQAFELILEMPGIGRRWHSSNPAIKDLCVTSVSRRFRDYLIFYRPVPDGVQIVTVVHGARDLTPLIESLTNDEL